MKIDPNKKSDKKKNVIDQIHETSDYNKEVYKKEALAKKDSVLAATRAKLFGKDVIDQRRAGNAQANVKRKELGIPKVKRWREDASAEDGDKYSSPTWPRQDNYIREGSLEKNMPRTTNSEFKNAMEFSGVKKKK